MIAEVATDARPISDAFLGSPCGLTVDPSVIPLSSRQAGTPGQAGYSVTISAVNPVKAATGNPPSCPAIETLTMRSARWARCWASAP